MSNSTAKYPQSNMAYQRRETSEARGSSAGRSDGRQNGNSNTFRTDSAISGGRGQVERTLQRWVPDTPANIDGSLESSRNQSSNGGAWDQFAENKRLFGLTTDYDENIYTTSIDKTHPQYKQRLAEADRKAREIELGVATNSHVAEERIMDHVGKEENGADEEDKYSGVHRQANFPPLPSSNNKYMPPGARRTPTTQTAVNAAPVDPAIISSQLARPDKPAMEKSKIPPAAPKPTKTEASTPPTTTESSFTATPEPKQQATATPSTRNASPQVKPDGVPNATATVERDVATAFKGFAAQQRKNVEISRVTRARNDKEIKLNDLKNFANSFKLHTPVPSDLVSIIAKDPKKQKEIQEKAQRNAEEASKANSADAAKTTVASTEVRPAARPSAASQGPSTSNTPSRQNNGRNSGFQGSFRGPPQPQSAQPNQQNRVAGNLGARLRSLEANKHGQMPLNPIPVHEARLPPTGPSSSTDPNFSRRSSGVASAQGARLNPNSSEFRPSPHAPTFSPNGNPSTGSSPRSGINAASPAPVSRSLVRHRPDSEAQQLSIRGKFDALEQIKTLKPPPTRDWKATGGLKPAYDTPPVWKQAGGPDEKPDSLIKLTYTQLFEMAPFPAQTMSPPNPSTVYPQVPHQHQLPIHLQHGAHTMGVRQSPRQPPMGLHNNQIPHGPTTPFSGPDDHRMMPSHSAQSFASPRLQPVPIAYPSPMNQSAQMAYNQGMIQYPGAPPMQSQMRSFSQNQQFMPQQGPMGPIMMQNPTGTFLTSQGMPPGPHFMPQGQGPFMPGNGHPPPMPGVNGYPSPGRSAPMMISQGSQHGHQQPLYGMSPGPQFGGPVYQQQQPVQMSMRGFSGPTQFGTSPQHVNHFGGHGPRNNHPNGNYNNNKSGQHQHMHQSGPTNGQTPTGPQSRGPEGNDEAK